MTQAAIRFDALTKHYGDVLALRSVDLTVERGELFGFLGPNGSGKTTSIRIMLDLIRPTAGHVEVLGFDAQRESVEVRRRIGYLPGEPQYYKRMTALEYLTLLGSLRGHAVDIAHRDRLIERLELEAGRRIGALSRGNRQKVGIVAALMSRPELLVLDEPTSGLDPLMQEVVEDLLREAAADGATVFFSSHLLPEVEDVCSRVAMLRAGRVVDVVDLAEQRRIAPLRVAVTFARPPARSALEGIPGAPLDTIDGSRVVFETHDGIDALVKRLAGFTIARLETHQPTLEELFLSYYGEHEEAPTEPAAEEQEAPRAAVS